TGCRLFFLPAAPRWPSRIGVNCQFPASSEWSIPVGDCIFIENKHGIYDPVNWASKTIFWAVGHRRLAGISAVLFDECWTARGQISAALLQRGDGLRHGRGRGAASLSDAEPLADGAGLNRSRQAIEMEGTFIVAVLGDAAKLEPLLHIGPASRR